MRQKCGKYPKEIVQENLRYYIYNQFGFTPMCGFPIGGYKVESPFALKSRLNANAVGLQRPDVAYILGNSLGLCGECIGQMEYHKTSGENGKSRSLAHYNVQRFYRNRQVIMNSIKYPVNIFLAQKVMIQLLGVYLEMLRRGMPEIHAYFSGEDTVPRGYAQSLDVSEVQPTLQCFTVNGHISSYTRIASNASCKPDIVIYEIYFPTNLARITELLSSRGKM
jgi:hypothetical protein